MDDKTLVDLAEHVSHHYGIDTVMTRTREEAEADEESFTPLGADKVMEYYQQLTESAKALSADLVIPCRPATAVIDDDGAEYWIPMAKLTPDKADQALMCAAAEVAALYRAASEAACHFAAVLRVKQSAPGEYEVTDQ